MHRQKHIEKKCPEVPLNPTAFPLDRQGCLSPIPSRQAVYDYCQSPPCRNNGVIASLKTVKHYGRLRHANDVKIAFCQHGLNATCPELNPRMSTSRPSRAK